MSKPLRTCLEPGCPTLTPHGRCAAHAAPAAHGWRGDTARMRGRALQRLRRALFTEEPLCRTCKANGLIVAATIRDHIVPLAEGGTDDRENIQPLCRACSDAKTAAEARRGLARTADRG